MSNREAFHQLILNAKEVLNHAFTNPKVASIVSGGTIGSGVGTVLEWIPNDIGKLATVAGMILSLVLIYSHIVRIRNDRKRHNLEHEKRLLELEILRNEAEKLRQPTSTS